MRLKNEQQSIVFEPPTISEEFFSLLIQPSFSRAVKNDGPLFVFEPHEMVLFIFYVTIIIRSLSWHARSIFMFSDVSIEPFFEKACWFMRYLSISSHLQ